jgi:RNA polymerase-binding transcription factor DksA
MSNASIPELRLRLQTELVALRTEILNYLQYSSEAACQNVIGRLEQKAVSHWPELLRECLTPELELKNRRLEQIQAALSQMDMGLYGLCCDCDSRIERDLLIIDPAHQRCRRCDQRRAELRQNPH